MVNLWQVITIGTCGGILNVSNVCFGPTYSTSKTTVIYWMCYGAWRTDDYISDNDPFFNYYDMINWTKGSLKVILKLCYNSLGLAITL